MVLDIVDIVYPIIFRMGYKTILSVEKTAGFCEPSTVFLGVEARYLDEAAEHLQDGQGEVSLACISWRTVADSAEGCRLKL